MGEAAAEGSAGVTEPTDAEIGDQSAMGDHQDPLTQFYDSVTVAERAFTGAFAESEMFDAVDEVWKDMVNDTSFDHYDNSIEVYFGEHVPKEFQATTADLEKLRVLGFTTFFLNYGDQTIQYGQLYRETRITARAASASARTHAARYTKLREAKRATEKAEAELARAEVECAKWREEHPAIGAMLSHGDRDPPNYLEIHATRTDGSRVAITMQKVDGKSPHQLRMAAEAERDALRAALDWIARSPRFGGDNGPAMQEQMRLVAIAARDGKDITTQMKEWES